MESLLQVRQHYGLSQASLAIYLSVSVSLLKMAEKGKRELPLAATIKLTQLQSLVSDTHAVAKTSELVTDKERKNSTIRELRTYIHRSEERVRKNQQALVDMYERRQQVSHCMQLIARLKKQLVRGEEGKKDKVWLELLELDTMEELKKYSPEAEALLTWRTNCYIHNVEEAKRIMATLV